MSEKPSNHHHLDVVVLTTSGRWPESGHQSVPLNQKIRQVLALAARHLGLAATDGWIATLGAKILNLDASFRANGIEECVIQIDFGPRQGGGGA